jgi:phenylacetate-CoA ligase
MGNEPNSLLDWPHQVPALALHCLADAEFIRALELGPANWWQTWQRQRLCELLRWLKKGNFNELPIQSREDFRVQFEAGPAKAPAEHGAMAKFQSSGSCGVPVQFWRTELATRINLSHYWADHQRQGRDLHKTMAIITGTPGQHDDCHLDLKGEPWLHPGRQFARNSPQFTMDEHARWICEHAPNYLVTTPGTLSSILSIIEMTGLQAPKIAQVMTSSHAVEPDLRVRTRRVLGATIRDRYSCEELGPVAFQCPQSDDCYHVAVGNVIVEVVDASGQAAVEGTQGSVLVTGLHQWATPALRYELGDIAALHTYCPGCGATVPALSHLMGRKYFLLNSSSQGLRHVRILAEHWLACAPVREHRVVQTSLVSFRAEVVLDRVLTDIEQRALLTMLSQLIGPEFNIELAQLNAIPWTSSKRHEFVGLTS